MGFPGILALALLVQPVADPAATVASQLRATPAHRIVFVPRNTFTIQEESLPLPNQSGGRSTLVPLCATDRFAGHPLEMAPMATWGSASHEARGRRFLAFDLEPGEALDVILADPSPRTIWLDVIEPRIDPEQSMTIRTSGGIRFRNVRREPAVVLVRVEGLATQAYQLQIRRLH